MRMPSHGATRLACLVAAWTHRFPHTIGNPPWRLRPGMLPRRTRSDTKKKLRMEPGWQWEWCAAVEEVGEQQWRRWRRPLLHPSAKVEGRIGRSVEEEASGTKVRNLKDSTGTLLLHPPWRILVGERGCLEDSRGWKGNAHVMALPKLMTSIR